MNFNPLSNLDDQRELAHKIIDSDHVWGEPLAAHRLAELVLELDDYRERGGFDPYTATMANPEAKLAQITIEIDELESALLPLGDCEPDPPTEPQMGQLARISMHLKKMLDDAKTDSLAARIRVQRTRVREMLGMNTDAPPSADIALLRASLVEEIDELQRRLSGLVDDLDGVETPSEANFATAAYISADCKRLTTRAEQLSMPTNVIEDIRRRLRDTLSGGEA